MARITKERDERMNEILDVAESLFKSKGFEKTTVSDVVKSMGVAQGTFYHYFKSKDEILNVIMERTTKSVVNKAESIENEKGLDAKEKLQKLINAIIDFDGWSNEMIEYVHNDDNILLHHMIESKSTKELTPVFSRLIRAGVRDGIFDSLYPDETAEIIINGIGGICDTLKLSLNNMTIYRQKLDAISDFLERILGAEKDSFLFEKFE